MHSSIRIATRKGDARWHLEKCRTKEHASVDALRKINPISNDSSHPPGTTRSRGSPVGYYHYVARVGFYERNS
eukprot:1736013-Pyramimonas_sp.AAC.1